MSLIFKVPIPISKGWDFFIGHCLLVFFSLCSIGNSAFAQLDPQVVGPLPSLLTEASGLQFSPQALCYTFNDSDDDSRLFRISTTGAFISQVTLQGVGQTDYEDIARASDGRYFVGDFGNNDNDREDLQIFILSDIEGASVVIPEVIDFTYEDQSEFPPDDQYKNFDVEAMIHWQDSLFLFTRNRTSPYNGLTKIYVLPDSPGEHIAIARGEIFGNLSPEYSSVRGADISPSGERLVWLTTGSVFLFTSLEDGLPSATMTYNYFNTSRAFEGITFVDECTVLLVEEGPMANIYSLNTCEILTGLTDLDTADAIDLTYHLGIIEIETELPLENVRIVDALGRVHLDEVFRPSMVIQDLSPGTYVAILTSRDEQFAVRFVVPIQ